MHYRMHKTIVKFYQTKLFSISFSTKKYILDQPNIPTPKQDGLIFALVTLLL